MRFSPNELLFLLEHPEAMEIIADYHSVKETEADAIGYLESANYHAARRKELREEAKRIREEWES